MDNKNWTNLHKNYSKQDWINKPSIFAEQSLEYFPKHGRLLEIGAGHGQDGIYFASRGFDVTSTDLEITSLNKNILGAHAEVQAKISAEQLDLRNPFHFDEKFDVIYAHLSLHYFDINGRLKRYLDTEEAKSFARHFAPLLADNNGETYKDAAQGIHHLIRFIGKKIENTKVDI